jgi:transposase-like protein
MRRKRRNHSVSFKGKVTVAAIRGDKALAELSEQFDVQKRTPIIGQPFKCILATHVVA